METNKVAELVRRNEQNYNSSTTTISEHVQFSLKDTVNRIDAYLNSKHISGDTDSLGRAKPFYNIVVSASNIWYRATDIDRKNIKIKPTKKSQYFSALVATEKLQQFMRKDNFGTWLNEWGRTLARYGSAVSKFVEKDGQLHASVIPFNRLIIDSVSFDNDVAIEVLDLTPDQLLSNEAYDRECAIELVKNSQEARRDNTGQTKDTIANFIRVYEVHGMMPLSWATGKEKDEYTYAQQMYVVSFNKKNDGKYDDYVLAGGREEKNPYHIAHLLKEDGRVIGRGAVENLFDSQWQTNHSFKLVKDQLDLASKIVFQTSDDTFVGANAISAVETGDILVHKENHPLTQLANNSHDITSLENYATMWKTQANEVNGISEAMLGQNAPSGTAWRQVEALLNESHGLFALFTENKGLAIEEIMRTFILPYIKKQLGSKEEMKLVLSSLDIEKVDAKYTSDVLRKYALSKIIKSIDETGEIPVLGGEEIQGLQNAAKDVVSEDGNVRYFSPSDVPGSTWAEALKDLEWELEIDVTGEQSDAQSTMATLTTVLQTVASNPGMLNDPTTRMLFDKIITLTGAISPVEITQMNAQAAQYQAQTPPMMQQPAVPEA